jgi:hypothetical protein
LFVLLSVTSREPTCPRATWCSLSWRAELHRMPQEQTAWPPMCLRATLCAVSCCSELHSTPQEHTCMRASARLCARKAREGASQTQNSSGAQIQNPLAPTRPVPSSHPLLTNVAVAQLRSSDNCCRCFCGERWKYVWAWSRARQGSCPGRPEPQGQNVLQIIIHRSVCHSGRNIITSVGQWQTTGSRSALDIRARRAAASTQGNTNDRRGHFRGPRPQPQRHI